MDEVIKAYKLEVEIQDNGIIRDSFGWIVGRCDDEWFASVVRHKLPEQPERTCRLVYPQSVNGWVGYAVCSNCGTKHDESVASIACYCPQCGAKVVE